MTDPRHPNTRSFSTDSAGKVVGVELQILERPHSRYRLKAARLLDEYEANGQTVAQIIVQDKSGGMVSEPVRLAWPWNGSDHLPHGGYPGNTKLPAEHIITNGYNPPGVGPLAIYVGRPGAPESDIIGGLGLPFNRHVSFHLTFQERGSTPDEPGNPPPDVPTPEPPTDLSLRVDALEADIARLRRALGIWATG